MLYSSENTNKKNGCLEIANKDETFKILGSKWEDITKKHIIYSKN